MKNPLLEFYRATLIAQQTMMFKYKRFLDNQLDYCYHILNEDNKSKPDVKESE